MTEKDSRGRKKAYFAKLASYLEEYSKVLIVEVTNVGAAQIQQIRKSLRGKAKLLMGKNTVMRKCLWQVIEAGNTAYEGLVDLVKGNVGLVFTHGDLPELRSKIEELKVSAVAKAGSISPCEVIIPAGPTGMEPSMTSFLHALNISSKIVRGQIEIQQDVHLIKTGQKVGQSEAALLTRLAIAPFQYGLKVTGVSDNGFVYDAALLDLTDNDILGKFAIGIQRVATLSLAIDYPTVASLPHVIVNAYKNVLSVSLGTDYDFDASKEIKKMLENPGAFISTPAPVDTKPANKPTGKPVGKPAPEPEPDKKDDSEENNIGGLFDD